MDLLQNGPSDRIRTDPVYHLPVHPGFAFRTAKTDLSAGSRKDHAQSLTMYDSLADLNKGARSIHSDKMRRLVEKMSRELKATTTH
ncbi:hypothetical protein JTE90_004457 [Oedothorax gibbosus]|uniref:Uncharacterized protein n=1 Tax=Oedothorax gibbosus TaxID=931172 RepID=A0AAV6TJ15_9ARAC|nr:hypothetical protein JTE90_004457 [Oedothorax gibbosus]